MSTLKRIAFALVVVAVLLLASAPAFAIDYTGPFNDVPHRNAANAAYWYGSSDGIPQAIESVWPGFYANTTGGQAFLGHINCNGYLGTGFAFTDQFMHEIGHELQLATDQPGGYGSLSVAWYGYLESYLGWTVPTEVSYATANHWLTENISGYFFYPYASNSCGYSFGYQTMLGILQSVGVTP